ncbi:MAG: DUF4403 family protein [Verrucomicrobiales bacterium]|nr:DUF4403 family protein [Verrucomicrobiales bacterium]
MKKLFLVLLVLGLIVLAAIGSIPIFTKVVGPRFIQVSPPTGQAIGEFDAPKSETSVLSVTMDLPVDALAAVMNREAPREISENQKKDFHKRVKNGTLQWKMARGDIALQNTGQGLAFNLPIGGVALAAGMLDARIISLPIQGKADLRGNIMGLLRPTLSENWQMSPNVQPLLKLSQADLSLDPIGTVSARGFIEEAANPIIQREAAKLGPKVIKELDFKADVQKLWDEAHVIEKINDDPSAWIIVDPQRVVLGPVNYSNPSTISVDLSMIAQSFVSNTEADEPVPEPLPNLDLQTTVSPTDIRIPIVANISELNTALQKENISMDTKVGATVNITEPEVQVGQGGRLNISLNIQAGGGAWGRGVSGRIWLEGKPIIDYENQTLGLTEVTLTVESRQALSKAAVWLLEELLVKTIERELRADLKEHIPELEEEIQKFLTSGELPDDIQVIVGNPEVKLLDVYTITRTAEGSEPAPGIVVVLGGKGNIIVRLSDI